MFLDEFGTEHAYSQRIAMRLADCLAPLDLDSTEIVHTPSGPEFHPQWRMRHRPRPERLRQAVVAYDLAAQLASDPAGAGRALLRIGWVHRALGKWDASTAAWDRCATEAAATMSAADALWLAAENLAWTGQPAAAAQRLRRLTSEYPDHPRTLAAADRAECLDAEALRGARWLADPVASLQAEIEERAAAKPAHEVYKSAIEWLRRRGDQSSELAVSRWACTQTGWPISARLACHHDLADTLLHGVAGEAQHLEAAEVLGQVVALASDDNWAVPAALRRCRLLSELGFYEQADQTLNDIKGRVAGSLTWEPRFLEGKIRSLLDRGDRGRAMAIYERLSSSYPDHGLAEELRLILRGTGKEESR